jgi:hypothetical protein
VPSTLFVGRAEHAAVLAGKWLYFIGGYDPTGAGGGTPNYSPSIDALDTTLPVDNQGLGTQVLHSNAPANAVSRVAHAALALDSSTILVAGGLGSATTFVSSFQKYSVNSTTGAVTSATVVGTAQNLTTARARFQLLPAGPANQYLVFGGSTALAAGGDTATATMEIIDANLQTVAAFGNLTVARQALSVVSIAGTTHQTFVAVGGASSGTNGVEVVVGP